MVPRLLTQTTGYCHHRLHRRWYPSCISTLPLFNLRSRLLQACGRGHLRRYHGEQEPLGLWLFQIHHTLDREERIHPSHHDKYGPDRTLVLMRSHFLVLRQDFQEVDQKFKGPFHVSAGSEKAVVFAQRRRGRKFRFGASYIRLVIYLVYRLLGFRIVIDSSTVLHLRFSSLNVRDTA